MRIAIAQVRGQMDDPPANASKAKMLLHNTDVELLIFPELFATGIDKNCVKFAPNIANVFKNKAYTFVREKKCSIIYGCPMQFDNNVYNCAVLTDGTNEQVYKKIHLDVNEKFAEKDIFTAGNEPIIFDFNGLKIGIMMGVDVMYNEMVRWYTANGADIIVCIAAIPKLQIERYEKVIQSRCIENSIEMIFVNMVGPDPGFVLAGKSKYITYDGTVLENCTDSSDVRIIKLDKERIGRSKINRTLHDGIRKDIDWKV
jgi:NAD+ synthase (glutamine-hydrolysing)